MSEIEVSIIMPAYNRGKVIRRAIESVQRQTLKNWELIVSDDKSEDNTIEIVKEMAIQDERIRYVCNSVNKGAAAARNSGLRGAKGKYIAFLDSDDEWMEYHLQEAVYLLENSDYFICSASWTEEKENKFFSISEEGWFADSASRMSKELNVDISSRNWLFNKDFYPYVINTGFYCFHINTIVMEKIIVDKIGYFDENLKASEDMDFLYRIMRFYPLAFINREHFIYHYGTDNLYAFNGRDELYQNRYALDEDVKNRLIFNLKNKIAFFEKLNRELESVPAMYNLVGASIKYNILRRYLTIKKLSEDKSTTERRYHLLKYCNNFHEYFMVMFYKRKKYVDIYFCDD